MGKNNDAELERERHDEAMETLSRDRTKWDEERIKRIDFLNKRAKKQSYSVRTFDDVDQAMKEYYYVTGDDNDKNNVLGPEPKLSDYYIPSDDQRNRELLFVVGGMALTGYVAWKLI